MSSKVFNNLTRGNVGLTECQEKVYTYASKEPLKLLGKCNLSVCVPAKNKPAIVEFFIMPSNAPTLLGLKPLSRLEC